MKKITSIIVIAAILVIVIAGALLLYKKSNGLPDSGIVLFTSEACPHCQNVAKYIQDNGVSEKIGFKTVELSGNQSAIDALVEKAKACNLDTTNISIPFLWDGNNCLQGETDIINFFDLTMRAQI